MKSIDIVVPAFNEEACLDALHVRLTCVLDSLSCDARVIIVDDGSSDGTARMCREFASADSRFQYIRLSRNFGHQAALAAGMDGSDADAVITLDADLEHPPELIPEFIRAWQNGAEVVHGVRNDAAHIGFGKHISSRVFYRLLGVVSDVHITPHAPDFRLLDRKVVAAIRPLRERARFLRGVVAWVGFHQQWIGYSQNARAAGNAKYDPPKMFRLGISALVSFSRAPLRLATYLGFAVSASAFIYGAYAVAQALVFKRALPGWTSLAVLVSMLSGIQLLTLGVIGEYLGQTLEDVKGRPAYVIAEMSAARERIAARP